MSDTENYDNDKRIKTMLLAAVNQAAEEPFRIHDILRAASGALEVPVVVLLVVFLLAARSASRAGLT